MHPFRFRGLFSRKSAVKTDAGRRGGLSRLSPLPQYHAATPTLVYVYVAGRYSRRCRCPAGRTGESEDFGGANKDVLSVDGICYQ